ncbi:unnamed protein product [Mytilus coruscus]|uniref:Reverse transcriptase domain-containing protein n=1 Tax=Mytilus coruscus TaxID=42192 RepID=A0A6J8CTC3_MYTCO|nr:unnamed protein product [Mytilus coruscus]
MEQTLKDRVDKNKQLKELLPELHVNKIFSGKRKATGNQFSNDWSKKPKFDNAQQGSTFTGAKSGTQRTVLRTNTVTRPDKDDKSLALPFGPTSAPRVFTKVVSVVAAHLRPQVIRLVVYLDDWFLVNQASLMLVQDREIVFNLLVKLGFIINLKKSFLTPTQKITYIGALFHLDLGIVMPTQERVLKLQKTVKEMKLKNHATARDFLHLLNYGFLHRDDSYARLHMRPIQIYLLSHWAFTSQNLELNVPVTQYLKSHLIWWSDTANITKGRSLQHWETHVTITTDASTSNGWGGHMDSQIIQGTWSDIKKTQHINCLELEAVLKTIQHFLPQLKGKNVLLRCDNSTVVQYINKLGGTKSIQLCVAVIYRPYVWEMEIFLFIAEEYILLEKDCQNKTVLDILVPAFDAEKLLDPKRALTYYLKSTDNFRGENRQDSKLFLAISNPHNPISSQTISSWIVSTIQMAYNDKKKSVKAHSTRAIGPSWALYKGASMKNIMEAADWSRESTFTKFYLRHKDPHVLSK